MTLDQIKRENRLAGFYFFEPDAMRFFSSRCSEDVFAGPGGIYFASSERDNHRDYNRRLYSVRRFDPDTGTVDTLGAFQGFETLAQAKGAARRAAAASE